MTVQHFPQMRNVHAGRKLNDIVKMIAFALLRSSSVGSTAALAKGNINSIHNISIIVPSGSKTCYNFTDVHFSIGGPRTSAKNPNDATRNEAFHIATRVTRVRYNVKVLIQWLFVEVRLDAATVDS